MATIIVLIFTGLLTIFLYMWQRFHGCNCDNCKCKLYLPPTRYSFVRFLKSPRGKESNKCYRAICAECKQAAGYARYMSGL